MGRTAKEIRAEIREVRSEMKALGYRVTSFMNRQDPAQGRYNARLYALKLELERAGK
jgi:hypothetical protein